MFVFRIAQTKYIEDISGYGSYLYSGRWHTKGNHILYTAENRALSALEILVHFNKMGLVPKDYSLLTLYIPDSSSSQIIKKKAVPTNWRNMPSLEKLRVYGDRFIENKNFLCLKVPSALVPDEFNYLLNPNHPEMKKVKVKKIEPFQFDKRFIK